MHGCGIYHEPGACGPSAGCLAVRMLRRHPSPHRLLLLLLPVAVGPASRHLSYTRARNNWGHPSTHSLTPVPPHPDPGTLPLSLSSPSPRLAPRPAPPPPRSRLTGGSSRSRGPHTGCTSAGLREEGRGCEGAAHAHIHTWNKFSMAAAHVGPEGLEPGATIALAVPAARCRALAAGCGAA